MDGFSNNWVAGCIVSQAKLDPPVTVEGTFYYVNVTVGLLRRPVQEGRQTLGSGTGDGGEPCGVDGLLCSSKPGTAGATGPERRCRMAIFKNDLEIN